MYISLHVKYPLFLSDFNETWIFSTLFGKILKTSNFGIILPVRIFSVQADGRTDRHDGSK